MSEENSGAREPRHVNHLVGETSPYLLQHAHNPVDWHPWGEEALERARSLDRPIFLSIGYAACHWCHVMERESFEDPATADDLNDSFVAIKVDREERPDLDAIYMDAVQAMTGSGGWPMSVFLTPDGRPFYGGTYFPNLPGRGLPTFRDVLHALAAAWTERRAEVEDSASRLADAIARSQRAPGVPLVETAATEGPLLAGDDEPATSPSRGGIGIGRADLSAAVAVAESGFDTRGGGWGSAPKFPQPMTIEFLLREAVRTDDSRALALAVRSLEAMAAGGIHDHLGGGFARYSTDSVWLVPHFEKMLYDNAQLARVYLHAWQVTGEWRFAEVARHTLDFVARELRTPADGAFASSLDADTDGEEGATYTWTAGEIRDALGSAADLFAAAYGVTKNGNWEGLTILSRVRDDARLAAETGRSPEDVARDLEQARRRLHQIRDRRPQPRRDDKVLCAWNGLMIAAFAEAGTAFSDSAYLDVAREAGDFIVRALRRPDGRLLRSWKDGRGRHTGVLEDHADLADGLLALYSATFEESWFTAARDLMEVVLTHFADPGGGFFDTADDHETLIARPRGLQDNALPSGGAMTATVLLRLAALTGEARHRLAAERAIAPVAPITLRYPTAFAQWLQAAQLAVRPIDEIAIVGDLDAPDTRALLEVARGVASPAGAARRPAYRPWQVISISAKPDASSIPLLHGRIALGGRPTAFVCRAFTCHLPVTDPVALAAQLDHASAAEPRAS